MKPGYYYCSECGKKLIQRMNNGLYRFIFGGRRDGGKPRVEILIHGNIKMKCLRGSCVKAHPEHWNVFTFFPNVETEGANQELSGVDPVSVTINQK